MTFNPTRWYPLALVLAALNVVAAAFTDGGAHAAGHAALAAAFAIWAQRLKQRRDHALESGSQDAIPRDDIDELDADVAQLRRELGEMHERLDFAERMLAQRPPAPVPPKLDDAR